MSQTNETAQPASLGDAIEEFLAAYQNQDAYYPALRRLEKFGNRAADALVTLLLNSKQPEERRERTTGALVGLQSRGVKRLLLEATRSHPEEWVRAAAVRALAFYYNSPQVIRAMLPLLQDRRNSAEIRSEAAHTIGMNLPSRQRFPDLIRLLIPYLHDPAPEVRLTAIYAIMCCPKPRHALNEIRRLVNDHIPAPLWNWTVAQEARWAVTLLEARGGVETDPTDPILLTDEWRDRIAMWKLRNVCARWKRHRRVKT